MFALQASEQKRKTDFKEHLVKIYGCTELCTSLMNMYWVAKNAMFLQ